ncbi:putative armadillo-like helical protein [Dioscorea sansibarensis]
MGFISRKLLPACGNICVCCPALRPSSRRPVKRYKKLLAEIFPKSLDGPPNERKILKLCEYATKNPMRIPKIAKYLEQRSYKELRTENVNSIKIIIEAFSKLLSICKDQMAYFAGSLLNVIVELLDNRHSNTIRILGCQTLTRFICSQADSTYTHNIESLASKVCSLARQKGEGCKSLRAASLQCLSSMVWFMSEYSHIFADIDEIICVTLDNYGADEDIEGSGGRRESDHHWVDEVVRCETRGGTLICNDFNPSNMTMRPHLEIKDSSMLTREDSESPEVWARICINKLADLAKESTTMRRLLDPMLVYFDTGKHWLPRNGLALVVLSDMAYYVKSSGNEQVILAGIIRHLDHKNVVHDPQTKADIVLAATSLVRQLKSREVVLEVGVVSDLCRHLRKTLQATLESVGQQQTEYYTSLQNSIEDCLLEIAKGVGDACLLFDMMAISLEKLPTNAVVARATMGSLLILAHIISLASFDSKSELVLPEVLLLQLLKAMMHPDVETRVGAHQIFSAVLIRTPNHPRQESEYLYEPRKWNSKTSSAFASATALLEKLRKGKECMDADKQVNDITDDIKEKEIVWKGSPNVYKMNYAIMDKSGTSTPPLETKIIMLTEEQTAQLLSAFWLQAIQPDNLPSNFEAIAHSFSLTLVSSRLKNSNYSNTIRAFQLCFSLRNAAFDSSGILAPSYRRSLFTLATGMLGFAGKIYHIPELTDPLKYLLSCIVDPYLGVGDDMQVYTKYQADIKDYGSDFDQQAATSSLINLRRAVSETEEHIFDIIVRVLASSTGLEMDELSKQLSETFIPDDDLLFCANPNLDWKTIKALATWDESLSFDEEHSRSSSMDADMIAESPATDLLRFIPKMPAPILPQVISVGQLLESALHVAGQVAGSSISTSPLPYGTMASQCEALGMGTRKKLSSWLGNGHESISEKPTIIGKMNSEKSKLGSFVPSEPWVALRLPPASPFDNFLKAAGC